MYFVAVVERRVGRYVGIAIVSQDNSGPRLNCQNLQIPGTSASMRWHN